MVEEEGPAAQRRRLETAALQSGLESTHRFEALRQEAGVTQVELGARLGNTQTFVSKFERGERRLDVTEFVDVCEALGAEPMGAFARYLAARRVG